MQISIGDIMALNFPGGKRARVSFWKLTGVSSQIAWEIILHQHNT
jgi:hypothetical protein